MAENGDVPFLKTATGIVFEFALGVVLLVAVASLADWVTPKQAAMVFLSVAGAALLISAAVSLGRRHGTWQWIIETAERAMSTDSYGAVDDTGLYRFALLAVGFTVTAIPIGVAALMAILNLGFSEIWPYLLAALAGLLLVLALLAISYAPPGPNWIHRIAGIDGRALLIMAGIAVVVLGTLQFFEYGSDGAPPSDWWLTVVAIGLLIGLVGLSKRGREASVAGMTGADYVTADKVRNAARVARRHAVAAEDARRRAELAASGKDNALTREATRAAATADNAAEKAENAADSAATKAERAAESAASSEAEIVSMLAETERDADTAEVAAKAARNAAEQLRKAAEAAEESEG